ncbi:hypothetical protein ACODT5_21760 [Streptomyces sp. 5.8]|uniref:hypothetical protein n=1 Tax=Streptomyces sp. 5.8 TaxID=3406571 RepID=UPI003BB4FC01
MSVEAIDEPILLSVEQSEALIRWVSEQPEYGSTMRAFLAAVACAALRPAESAGLRVRDAILPESGLGELAIPRPWREQADRTEGADGLRKGEMRRVPASSELVEVLREEVSRRGLTADDLLFAGTSGEPMSSALYRRAWARAREAVLDPNEVGSPLGRQVSDLRDACVARWLVSGISVFAVAEVVGTSASYLAKRFPHCFPVGAVIPWDRIELAQALDLAPIAATHSPRRSRG